MRLPPAVRCKNSGLSGTTMDRMSMPESEHGRLFDEYKSNALPRCSGVHQRGKHGAGSVREVPLSRNLGTEIGEGFNRAQEPAKIFFLCCHPFAGATDTQSNSRVACAEMVAVTGFVGYFGALFRGLLSRPCEIWLLFSSRCY